MREFGTVHLYINDWIEVSFSLHQKALVHAGVAPISVLIVGKALFDIIYS
jgi:hypothetical protein